ncbi:hypothetical protein BC826DRAFT_1023071 [Russula brevipes]|nr:hypothetical protein BC826DRAFT_1023071 [Russula brevipes]
MVFERLTSLNVNISHAIVAQFLQAHPHIEDLTLGACLNVQDCPFSRCSLSLPSLQFLTCPPSCVRALTDGTNRGPMSRLVTTYDGARRLNFPIARLLDFRQISTSTSLTVLHIDFDHTVNKFSHKSQVAQMPWYDENNWKAGLSLHRNLERLLLRTWGFLIETDREDTISTTALGEANLVNRWVKFAPPKLYNLVIWTRSCKGRGHMHIWDLQEMGHWKMRGMSSTDVQKDLISAAFL